MKINRLLEMTIILLNHKRDKSCPITAKELAERFCVSTRTIYRDLDELSAAGVPIYTNKGTNGGISLLENYTLDKTFLSQQEGEGLLLALKALRITQYPDVDMTIDKLGALLKKPVADWIQIDLSPWSASPNENGKLSCIKQSLQESRVLAFNYVNAEGIGSTREVEPTQLQFKGQAWYLWGWCRQREAYRTFRISRMKQVKLTNEVFHESHPEPPTPSEDVKPYVMLRLRFQPNAMYRLYDDFDDNLLMRNSDGTVDVTVEFPMDEWIYSYLLSFGSYVEVLEPKAIRDCIHNRCKKMLGYYE